MNTNPEQTLGITGIATFLVLLYEFRNDLWAAICLAGTLLFPCPDDLSYTEEA